MNPFRLISRQFYKIKNYWVMPGKLRYLSKSKMRFVKEISVLVEFPPRKRMIRFADSSHALDFPYTYFLIEIDKIGPLYFFSKLYCFGSEKPLKRTRQLVYDFPLFE